jgi:hypothetical protein
MKRVINLDKSLNEPKFMNNRLGSDEAVKQAYCNFPYPVREAGKY